MEKEKIKDIKPSSDFQEKFAKTETDVLLAGGRMWNGKYRRRTREEIEEAVCKHFNISKTELYESKGRCDYPINGAKQVFVWMLRQNGMRRREIAEAVGISTRRVDYISTEVADKMASDTKIREDVGAINKLLSSNN